MGCRLVEEDREGTGKDSGKIQSILNYFPFHLNIKAKLIRKPIPISRG